jgi:hypothetical protein
MLLCPCSMTGRFVVHVLVVLPAFLNFHTLGIKIIVNLVAGNLFRGTSYFEVTVHITNSDISVLYSISLFLVFTNESITFILI